MCLFEEFSQAYKWSDFMNYNLWLTVYYRTLVDLSDLTTLCEDISWDIFHPFEHVTYNAFYGIDFALKQYVGIPHAYHLKAHYSHISLMTEGCTWIKDYNVLPTLFTWAPSHEKAYSRVCNKPMHSIGPIIHYAKSAYTEEKIAAEKKRLGHNALVFPAHSTHAIPVSFEFDLLLKSLEELKKHFDSIRICIYWKDYLQGQHEPFVKAGYECVTAGHMFDPNFLPRLKALLSVADHTISNAFGAYIAYAVYMQIPHLHLPQKLLRNQSNDAEKVGKKLGIKKHRKKINNVLQHFTDLTPKVTPGQYKMCNEHFGYDYVRTPNELLELIYQAEDVYKASGRLLGEEILPEDIIDDDLTIWKEMLLKMRKVSKAIFL